MSQRVPKSIDKYFALDQFIKILIFSAYLERDGIGKSKAIRYLLKLEYHIYSDLLDRNVLDKNLVACH